MDNLFYSYGDPANAMGISTGPAVAWLTVAIISSLIFLVLQIIAMWRLFKKAGKHGWAAIIPIYNLVVLFNVAGMSGWWTLALLGISLVNGLAQNISNNGNSASAAVLTLLASICSLILYIYLYNRIAKAFGKGTGFTVGLVLLSPIFLMILGFGSAKYNAKALKAKN